MRKICRYIVVLALVLSPAGLLAQEGTTITGRVTSETGAPLQSVSVFIAGTSIGTLTRATGVYTLVLPAGRFPTGQEVTLTAQIVGYRTETATLRVTPGAAFTQDFRLNTDVLQLEGIVATGVGQVQARERLGVSINSVTAEQITRAPAANLIQAMAAKAPNVEVQTSSGDPGAASYIRIRGVNTIAGSGQPLFVVDGVPVDNTQIRHDGDVGGVQTPNRASDINPNDIASIEILKGAAAAAIYGARAANGVVLITTRAGQPGVTRSSFTSTITLDEVNRAVPLQRRFGQGSGGNPSQTSSASWGPELPAGTPTFDHFGEMFRTGQLWENNLSVSGGSERTTYFLSVGHLDHRGTIVGPNNWYERTTARLRAAHRLTDNLNVTGNVSYAQTEGAYIQKGSNISGLMLGALRTPPEFDNRNYLTDPTPTFPRGLHRSYQVKNPTALTQTRGYDNPFWVVNEHRNNSETGRIFGNIALDFTPLPWLTVNYILGNDYYADERLTALPPSSSDRPTGRMVSGQYINQQLDHNLLGTVNHQLRDDIGASVTLGYNRNSRDFRQYVVEGYDWVSTDVVSINNTVTQIPDDFTSRIHSESFFGQAQVDLFDQLFLTAALRNDGFSTFGASRRRHWYPKVSAAWDVTRALGWQREANPFLSFAKLRAAWGQAGNEPDVYGTITQFEFANILDGGWGPFLRPTYGGRGGVWTSWQLGQPDLEPERTTEFEVGADLSLLRDLLGLQVTYYNAMTRDAIFAAPLAPTTGYELQLQNAAQIRNRGVEVMLDARPLRSPLFSWDVGLQWATNDNRVLDLGAIGDTTRLFVDMIGAFAGAPGAAVRGERVGVLRGFDWYRCGREGLPGAIADACRGAPTGAVYVGANGEPLIDPETRVVMDPHPDWTASIRNTFTLMNAVNITTLFDIRQGGQMWNGTRGALYHFGTHQDTEDRGARGTFAQRYGEQVVGPGANQEITFNQSWFQGLGSGFGDQAAQFIEDAGFVKLREVAIGYTVPTTLAQRLGMGGIELRLAGRNLHTWTRYTGIDPETNLAGNTNLRGIDYFNNPQTRQWIVTVGLNR